MSGLVIKGCEYDPVESRDVVYGDGFRMDLAQAIALVSTGVEFRAADRDGSAVPVSLARNEYDELILKTEPTAHAANPLGEISAPPIVHRRYRAEAQVPVRIHPGYAVAA